MTPMIEAAFSANAALVQSAQPHLVLRQSREPVEIIHIEDDQNGRRILVETLLGRRLLVTEAALEASLAALDA